MKNTIKNIIQGDNLKQIFQYVLNNLYRSGPISVTDMEILSYLSLYQNEIFEIHKSSILNYMAVFYKETEEKSLKDVIFNQYKKYINENYQHNYTPVQANIIKEVANSQYFSFSAPTSTGKSFVFMNMIKESIHDVVVIVPSRALINEYYLKLCNQIQDKSVNILTFIDKINTANSQKSIFIITPERCRELFKYRDKFTVDLFLFDEAQLSDEDSKRGLYFDSIVRRCQAAFPYSKFIFAHPFVENPDSQIEKNHFDKTKSNAIQYKQKNVGQMFLCVDDNWNYFHFGIEKAIMGNQKVKCPFDPIKKVIEQNGTVLFYISKSKIYDKRFLTEFRKYIDLCKSIDSEVVDSYINKLKEYTGGDTIANKNYYSQMIALLKRGIVIHHGSLPLQTRIIIEEFTKAGFCRICFATSTLEQGINMPFDIVFLDRLEASKPLAVKNLIGRAGRSTSLNKFDYGFVIISSPSNMAKFREIINQDEILSAISSLESTELHDDDYNEFREAILNGTLSDEYNLTENELNLLETNDAKKIIELILNSTFSGDKLIDFQTINSDDNYKLKLYEYFSDLYSTYLGRNLEDGENDVLNTAIKIMLWRIYGKTFKNICWYRYSYASRTKDREILKKHGHRTDHIMANYMTGYHDFPDKHLPRFGLFLLGTKAKDVDYDLVMYDTYDYIDKLIGFKLSDVYYAAFSKYYEEFGDIRALRLAKYIKYGTDSERYIWMLRYGMSFEDIETIDKHIESINAERIIFKDSIRTVPDEEIQSIIRFIP